VRRPPPQGERLATTALADPIVVALELDRDISGARRVAHQEARPEHAKRILGVGHASAAPRPRLGARCRYGDELEEPPRRRRGAARADPSPLLVVERRLARSRDGAAGSSSSSPSPATPSPRRGRGRRRCRGRRPECVRGAPVELPGADARHPRSRSSRELPRDRIREAVVANLSPEVRRRTTRRSPPCSSAPTPPTRGAGVSPHRRREPERARRFAIAAAERAEAASPSSARPISIGSRRAAILPCPSGVAARAEARRRAVHAGRCADWPRRSTSPPRPTRSGSRPSSSAVAPPNSSSSAGRSTKAFASSARCSKTFGLSYPATPDARWPRSSPA